MINFTGDSANNNISIIDIGTRPEDPALKMAFQNLWNTEQSYYRQALLEVGKD